MKAKSLVENESHVIPFQVFFFLNLGMEMLEFFTGLETKSGLLWYKLKLERVGNNVNNGVLKTVVYLPSKCNLFPVSFFFLIFFPISNE